MSFVCKFLHLLDSIKTYHWQTHSYARHKTTDELHGKLSELVDNFVETYYGKYTDRPSFNTENDVIILENCDDKHAEQNLLDFVQYATGDLEAYIKDNVDLKTIRDEIVAAIHHALYLFSFA